MVHKNRSKTKNVLSYGVAIDFTRHIDWLLNSLKLNNLMMKRAELFKLLSSFHNENEKSAEFQSNQYVIELIINNVLLISWKSHPFYGS